MTFIVLSGLFYNVGLLAVPWFESKLAQRLADILGGSETAAAMAMLVLAYRNINNPKGRQKTAKSTRKDIKQGIFGR